jgi:hypothetical protein
MTKETHFVIWRSGSYVELSPILPDTQLIHYEVEIDSAEKGNLEDKLAEVRSGDVMPEQVFGSPFDETKDEKEKMELGEDENDLFHLIYRYGSTKTKKQLEELYYES